MSRGVVPEGGTILILGGAGMVGLQVAREACRELKAGAHRHLRPDGAAGHRLF